MTNFLAPPQPSSPRPLLTTSPITAHTPPQLPAAQATGATAQVRAPPTPEEQEQEQELSSSIPQPEQRGCVFEPPPKEAFVAPTL